MYTCNLYFLKQESKSGTKRTQEPLSNQPTKIAKIDNEKATDPTKENNFSEELHIAQDTSASESTLDDKEQVSQQEFETQLEFQEVVSTIFYIT